MLFTQKELEDAYKQMEQERAAEAQWAYRAAQKLRSLLQNRPVGHQPDSLPWLGAPDISPFPRDYLLYIQLSQYDDWDGTIALLQSAKVKMQPWSRRYSDDARGLLDLSADPQFAASRQKHFEVRICFYDAHGCGF